MNTYNKVKDMGLAEAKNFALSLDVAEKRALFVGEDKTFDPEHYAVWNVNKDKVAALVSKDYNIVQHETLINDVIDAVLLLGLKARVEINDGGNILFADITFPDAKIKLEKVGEEFFSGIRVINSYNKQTGIMIVPKLTRLACSNGMIATFAWKQHFKTIHTTNLAKNFTEIIPKMISDMVEHNDHFRAYVEASLVDSAGWEATQAIVKQLIVTEKHREEILKILAAQNQEKFSRWDMYNAITKYTSHIGKLSPVTERNLQDKAQLVLTRNVESLTPLQEATL